MLDAVSSRKVALAKTYNEVGGPYKVEAESRFITK